jgi:hypothetical protein
MPDAVRMRSIYEIRAFEDCRAFVEAIDFGDSPPGAARLPGPEAEKDKYGEEHATEEAVRGTRQVVDEL